MPNNLPPGAETLEARPQPKHPFEYQRPTEQQVVRIERVRQACKELHATLIDSIEPCRERSLAVTKLEEVSMWANKAIVFGP
jgi:hypothetical protein